MSEPEQPTPPTDEGAHPEHPIYTPPEGETPQPPGIWGPPGPWPSPPIYLPPSSPPGIWGPPGPWPSPPIFLPPSQPPTIWPPPGVVTPPIYYPPVISGPPGPWPTPPIVIPEPPPDPTPPELEGGFYVGATNGSAPVAYVKADSPEAAADNYASTYKLPYGTNILVATQTEAFTVGTEPTEVSHSG